MNAAVPARSQDLRDTASIIAIGLVAHRCERRTHLACLEADHLKACGLQSVGQYCISVTASKPTTFRSALKERRHVTMR
jgi:hypothetical protein